MEIGGITSAVCERGRERRGNKRGGGGGVWTSLVTGLTGTPIVLCSHQFWRRGQKKKGEIGRKARDLIVVTGPPTSPPLVGAVWTEGKAAEQSTLDWGFMPQQRDCHKTAFQSSRGLVLLRFQVCIWSMLASLSLTDLPLPDKR